MKMPVWFRTLKAIVFVFMAVTALLVSCDDCEPCRRAKFVDAEEFLFVGRKEIKVHGPINGKYESVRRLTLEHYKIEGHDYFYGYITGTHADFGIFHSVSCRKCKEEKLDRQNIYNELQYELQVIKDQIEASGSKTFTKRELESMFKRYEESLVQKFDDIVDAWD